MEVGAHVWLRREDSHWGWVPAIVTSKEALSTQGAELMKLTLNDDPNFEATVPRHANSKGYRSSVNEHQPFEEIVIVDPEQLKTADHDDIKLRNLPTSYQMPGEDPEAGVIASPSTKVDSTIVGGVDDLIELTHLHEPAILHALRLRYDADIIYTSTGPILIAVNPFKPMPLYSDDMMEQYRMQGEMGIAPLSPQTTTSAFVTPFRKRKEAPVATNKRLPPHVYQTADDAYRAMMRGLENKALMHKKMERGDSRLSTLQYGAHTNQSILVSGESGAGKTVTTKIVLNYFAMLSKRRAEQSQRTTPRKNGSPIHSLTNIEDGMTEQQVLQSNPILESFGNARTSRNDNSSRFGKYIDISFSRSGKLSGASIETYLLEKVRLIHPSPGERNYHVFYQFLSSATAKERKEFFLGNMTVTDFRLLSSSGTYGRRDGVSDEGNHQEMLEAMITMGFSPETIQALMRLVIAVLFAGNMTFTPSRDGEACSLDRTDAALACASLLGISFDGLAQALTARVILAGEEIVHKTLTIEESNKACEALIKAVYGAAFDYVVDIVNESIHDPARAQESAASIGVLDIFGFESFKSNSFEQLCINYTNEALQQQFNKYVFKLEQQEYEKEGIMWKFISFPDNQDVLDLIDKKHTGILALLDEQCILPRSTDQKFTRYLYARCDKHNRFSASSAQRVDYLFSIEHYAGYVEYTTDAWLEKNKDQLPAASSDLLNSSSFGLIGAIKKYIRSEDRAGRGTVATKSVSSQFSAQLKTLRARIDETTPHYIRCLKPNDELSADFFEPKNVVEQLRCGGVLEAVRVSRAGYPTRYPHDIFMARYYILGDSKDTSPLSPLFAKSRQSSCPDEEDLKRLIAKIAYDLWEADHVAMQNLIQVEKLTEADLSTPAKKIARKQSLFLEKPKIKQVNTGPASVNAPPFSLVVESSVMTPEYQKKKKGGLRKRRDSHHVTRPETKEEFLKLDFASRCAVAGLQLGRSKVFLRREAFDRIEAMRSDKFSDAARTIQKMVRGKLCKMYYQHMRLAAIKIQSLIRMQLSTYHVYERRVVYSAVKIQSAWRAFFARMIFFEAGYIRRTAAMVIQRAYRSYLTRGNVEEFHISEDDIIRAVIAVQAMHRGARARAYVTDLLNSYAVEQPPSPVKTLASSPEQRHDVHEASREIVPTSANPSMTTELFREIQQENWAMVENILDKHPELAQVPDLKTGELALHKIARHAGAWTLLIDMVLVLFPKALVHRDNMGALPIHHAAAHDNLAALEIIYSAYKEGIKDADKIGRLPIHVAAHYDAVDAVKFLLAKSPEGAYTMIVRPQPDSGGGLPLHVACSNHASVGVITALLAENFASAKRTDENGDLPLHLLLRRGDGVDPVVVKTLLTCFAGAVSRTDMHGDLPLAIAIKHRCRSPVINAILMQYPEAAGVLNGAGHSALFLAFENNADDRTLMGLLNHAPDLATAVDKKTGLLPIQVATENEHSSFIVHNLLKRDMPIDMKEKVRAQLVPHRYSWNHVVSNTDDMYHQVVTKVLHSCTQPQVLALAHVEGPDGTIALAAATPVCKHEMRVMLRLFNTLEVVNQKPAYTNPNSDTQIFYALRYDPPKEKTGTAAFTVLHDERDHAVENDYLEDWDDASQVSALSRNSIRSTLTSRSQQTIEDKLRQIRKEKGQQVIAKLTSRSDVVERELKIRKDHHLSRHYVPAIISVHHTVQHAAYSEAMAEPGYCITMEGADTTAENLMLDMRKHGKRFPVKALKRVGISLLHLHEHGIIHGDFGTHNIGKFGSRWKLLGVGGCVPLGELTDPGRGFYHPPESIIVDNKRGAIGKKSSSATVVAIPADATYDIWAYGVVVYEAIAGVPLSPYACRGKREMNTGEVCKIGMWDENSVRKALKHVQDDSIARDLLKRLLHHDPAKRFCSMREVLEHSFFLGGKPEDIKKSMSSDPASPNTLSTNNSNNNVSRTTSRSRYPGPSSVNSSSIVSKKGSQQRSIDHPGIPKSESAESSIENHVNGVKSSSRRSSATASSSSSVDSRRSFRGLRKIRMPRRGQQAN